MEEQTITISLEEYKQLRDVLEDYQKLLGEYKLLTYVYNQLTYQPEQEEVKEKNPIGFKTKQKGIKLWTQIYGYLF